MAQGDAVDVVTVPLSSLHEDPDNARVHGKRNLAAIEASLRQFGQVEPLIVQKGTGRVVGGNGRLRAMVSLRWESCAVVELDLTDAQAAALGLALNRTSELAEWDIQALGAAVRSIGIEIDLEPLGWAKYELEPILAANWEPKAKEESPEPGTTVRMTKEQREVFDRAVERMRVDIPGMTDGGVLAELAKGILEGGGDGA